MSWANWIPFTSVHAGCLVLRVLSRWPLGSCSPVCPLCLLCCVCGFLDHSAPLNRCARWVCCVCGALGSWAPIPQCARSFGSCSPLCTLGVLCVRPSWLLGCCSLVCPLGVLSCVCGVLGLLAPVHRCARSARCVCGILGYSAPVHRCVPLGVLRCACSVLGHLAPAHRCGCVLCFLRSVLGHLTPVHRGAHWLCFVASVVSTWFLFTGVPPWCIVLHLWCPWPLGSRSLVCMLTVLCVRCIGHLAPVHRCARSAGCVAFEVSFAIGFCSPGCRLSVSCLPCPWSLGSCSPVCAPGVLFVRCFCPSGSLSPVCTLGVLFLQCPEPLGSRSPVCTLGVLCCACCLRGHLAPVHWCARSVCCVVCAVSLTTWLL